MSSLSRIASVGDEVSPAPAVRPNPRGTLHSVRPRGWRDFTFGQWIAALLIPLGLGALTGASLATYGLLTAHVGGDEAGRAWVRWMVAGAWAPIGIGASLSLSVAIFYARLWGRHVARLRAGLVALGQNRPLEFHPSASIRPLRGLAEDTGRLAQVMSETDSLRLQFIAMVSHEMRAPIASVLGFSTMLLDLPNTLGHEPRRYLEIIHRQSNKLAKLVDDLLVAGRLDANRLDYAFAPVRVPRLVQEVIQDMTRAFPGRRIEWVNESRRETITADALRLKQVVTNLVQNGLKFSPNGQPVTVRLRDGGAGRHLIVDVIDRGIGMTPEEQTMLFQRFGRIRNERTRAIPGSGLGLYISQRIAQAHGGRIEVESEAGTGSRFSVYLQAVPGGPEGVESRS